VPDLVKSLPVDKALDDDIIVAYEMNGQPLPMLNGFPARLIVLGWYATYWVKSLREITVLAKPFEGFWVKTAYRIPDIPCGCVEPGAAPKKTIPINRMTTRSLIIEPASGSALQSDIQVNILGLAFFQRVQHQGCDRICGWRKELGRSAPGQRHGQVLVDTVVVSVEAGKAG